MFTTDQVKHAKMGGGAGLMLDCSPRLELNVHKLPLFEADVDTKLKTGWNLVNIIIIFDYH